MASANSIVTTLDPPAIGSPDPAYSQITIVPLSPSTKLITIAGQIAETSDGKIPGTLKEQIELCLWRVKTCLEAAGASVHDLTRVMYYFAEGTWEGNSTLTLLYEVLLPWLQGHRPASCGLVVKAMVSPEYMCEFEAQAIVGC